MFASEFLQRYFAELIQCAATVYLAFFGLVALIKSPSCEECAPYRKAKWLLVAYFASLSLNLFAWCFFNNGNWNEMNYNIAVTDVIMFFLEYMLLCNCYGMLLNRHFFSMPRLVADAVMWVVTSVTALSSLMPQMEEYRGRLLLVSVAVLVAYIGLFIYRFYVQYRRYIRLLDNYFSNDMQRFVRWTGRSIIMFGVAWLLAVASLFSDIYVNWFFQFYVITLHVYIVVSFLNYAPHYADLNKADEEPEEMPAVEEVADETSGATVGNTLDTRLEQWLADKKYLSEQLTIEDLAQAIGTNKNYLSYHINEKYGMSFSSWISGMRIAEAKRMMRENPDRKLEAIAYSSGFSSASYFSKVFSLHEGMSPTKWRKDCMA